MDMVTSALPDDVWELVAAFSGEHALAASCVALRRLLWGRHWRLRRRPADEPPSHHCHYFYDPPPPSSSVRLRSLWVDLVGRERHEGCGHVGRVLATLEARYPALDRIVVRADCGAVQATTASHDRGGRTS